MSKNKLQKEKVNTVEQVGTNIIKTAQRKNLKQLIIILSAFAVLISFVVTFVIVFNQSKKSVIASPLETPENVRIEETLNDDITQYHLTFDPVEHADYYSIYLFEGEEAVNSAIEENFVNAIPYITTTRTNIDVTENIDEIGEYYFSVQAVYRRVESYSSLLSDPKETKVTKYYTLQKTNVISQTTRQGCSISWRSVLNASKYNVKYELDIRYKETDESIFDEVQFIKGNSYVVTQEILDRMNSYHGNEFSVRVRAVSDNKFVNAGEWGEAQIFTYKKATTPVIRNDYDFIGGEYTFGWDKTDYTEGYYVFVNNKLVATITNNNETTYSFTPEEYGSYKAKVQSYNTNSYIDNSDMSQEMSLPDNRSVTPPIAGLHAERVNEQIRVSWRQDVEKTYYYVYIQSEIEENFVDANGNGLYDLGEEFTDRNNNGVYDGGFITKPGSTELYYERLDSVNELRFDLGLNPTGFYKISVKAARQSEYFDPSLGFVRCIIRFDETKGAQLGKPTISYDSLNEDIIYGAVSQEVKDKQEGTIPVWYMAPRASDNNGFEIRIYEGTSSSGNLLTIQNIQKQSLELSSYRYSLASIFNRFGAGKYYVTVKAFGGYLLFTDSEYSGVEVDHTIKLEVPQNVSIQEVRSSPTVLDDVTISFGKVQDATKYYVYANSSPDKLITVGYNQEYNSYVVTSGYTVMEDSGIITISNLYSRYFALDSREPGTYNFTVQACSDSSHYSDSEISSAVTYKLVKYVNTPVLSHTSQEGTNGVDTNRYVVFWKYKDDFGNVMFPDDQTFDVIVNGKRIATEISVNASDDYYSLDISASALPGANVVQVKANSRGNYLSSISEAVEFADREISPGVFNEYAYRYYIEYDYDISKSMKFGGIKSGNTVSYYLKFMSDKYGNRFRFWFDKNVMGGVDDRYLTYQDVCDELALDPTKLVYASETNVYLSGYTSKETTLNIEQEYIKYNARNTIHFEIAYDGTLPILNNNITSERAGYIIPYSGIITYTDLFHMDPVKDFSYDVFTNNFTFRYDKSLIENVQNFIIYYKFGEDGPISTVVLSKDDCMSRWWDGDDSSEYYRFNYLFDPNRVGTLIIKVEPASAGAVLTGVTDTQTYYTSKKLSTPQDVVIDEEGILSWSEVENISNNRPGNPIEPYYVEITANGEGFSFSDSFDWRGVAVRIFEKYPDLKNRKLEISARVMANGHQYVQREAFEAKLDYVGYYVNVSTVPGELDLRLVTNENMDDVSFITPNVTEPYYPQYKASGWGVSNVLDYTPSLSAPTLELNNNLLTIKKTEYYNTDLDYELYANDDETPIYVQLHNPLVSSREIEINIEQLLAGKEVGSYSLYAIAKHEDWGVQSQQSNIVIFDVTEDLMAAKIVTSINNRLQSFATKTSAQITFENENDLSKIKGFRIYFKAPQGESGVSVFTRNICVVKNTIVNPDGTIEYTFSGKIANSDGTEWEDIVDPTEGTIKISYDKLSGQFTVLYESEGNIFTPRFMYQVQVYTLGEQYYNSVQSQRVKISCLDGKFDSPIVYIEQETTTYTTATPSTNEINLYIKKIENVQKATIFMRNLLVKDSDYVIVAESVNIASAAGDYYIYTFNPYINSEVVRGLFQENLGLYEFTVEYDGVGYIQASNKSSPVYVYYSYQGNGVESVMAEPNISNLPLNLQITVNNSIYSNVDKSTFEKFHVELKPIENNVFKDDSEASVTVLELKEGNGCVISSSKGTFRGALLTNKDEKENTTTYNFAIPIKYISGFGSTWGNLNWNYIIEVSVDYTLTTNINDIVYNTDQVFVVDESKTTRLKLSKYASQKDKVVGKYYYHAASDEYILITSYNSETGTGYNKETGKITLNLAESNDETDESITKYEIKDDEFIYSLKFSGVYALYEQNVNTYVGKYANSKENGVESYRKIYRTAAVYEQTVLTALRLYGRRDAEIGRVNVFDREHRASLPYDEYQFTLRSQTNDTSGLTTSNNSTLPLKSNGVIMNNGDVMWDAADTQTTFYYMYYVWDYSSNNAKLFYNVEGRECFYELYLPNINSPSLFENGVFTYDFNNAKVVHNYISLTGTTIYCELAFDDYADDIYEYILNDIGNFYYKLDANGTIMPITKQNINYSGGVYYLEIDDFTTIELTGKNVYSKEAFIDHENSFENDLLTQNYYYELSGKITQILAADVAKYAGNVYVLRHPDYARLNDDYIYVEQASSASIYADIVNDVGTTYYYKLDSYGNFVELSQSNVSLNNEDGNYYLNIEGELPISLTGENVYTKQTFASLESVISSTLDVELLNYYYELNGKLKQITSTNLIKNDTNYYFEYIDIQDDLTIGSMNSNSAEWQNKWFSVKAKGVNSGKTMFKMKSYTDGTRNYVYGALIYAMKKGSGASTVLNKAFAPTFEYNISNVQIDAVKGSSSVTYRLIFNDFNVAPFSYESSGVTTQAIFNAERRAQMFDVVSVGGQNYNSLINSSSLADGLITVITPNGDIQNSYSPYSVRIKTKKLVFRLNGEAITVIPAVDISKNINAPIVIDENVEVKIVGEYDISNGEMGKVKYDLSVKAVDFATIYDFIITESDSSIAGGERYNGFKVVGNISITVDPSKMLEGSDYYYYTFNISEYMNSIVDELTAGRTYYIWAYAAIDDQHGVDSLELATGGGTGTSDNYKTSRDSFVAYTKAAAVTDVVFNLNGNTDVSVNGVEESIKTLSFTTGETEYENSVYRIQIIDNQKRCEVKFTNGVNEYNYAYYWTNNGTPLAFSDGVLRTFVSPQHDTVNNCYNITIDLTEEMTKVYAGDYTVLVTVIPVVQMANLTMSDTASAQGQNNRRLVLDNRAYFAMLVDSYIMNEIINGEPLYYTPVLINNAIYDDLANAGSKYYFRNGNNFAQILQSEISIEGGVFYYNKGGSHTDLTSVYIYKFNQEAEDYLSGAMYGERKLFNTKTIVASSQYDNASSSWLGNWVDLRDALGHNITATLEIAFKQGGNFVPIGGSNWTSLYDLKNLQSATLCSYLVPGEYSVYARIRTTFDGGTYFKKISEDNGAIIATEPVEIYSSFVIYQRHMIDESVHNGLNVEVQKDSNGQYTDILMPTGITQDSATYELYCYNSTGDLVFKIENIAHDSTRKVSILKYMLEKNELVTYGKYLFKIKWLASGAEINSKILNSDLNETKGIEFEFYNSQTLEFDIDSNKTINKTTNDHGQSAYKISGFDDYVYVENYELKIKLSKPQINSTLVYVVSVNNKEFVAHVSATISSWSYEAGKWNVSYTYSIIDALSNDNYRVDNDNGVLIFNLLPYIYGTESVVGEHIFNVKIDRIEGSVAFSDNNYSKTKNKRDTASENFACLYEDIYATNLDKVSVNEGTNYVLFDDFSNLYISELKLDEEGVLSWRYSENSRFKLVAGLQLIVRNVDVITEGNGSSSVVVKQEYFFYIEPVSGLNSKNLNAILIADNSTSINYNEIELRLILKEGFTYWHIPEPFTNEDIDSSTAGMKLDNPNFVWTPSILNGSTIQNARWTSDIKNQDPNVISFDLKYNGYYANDFRLQGEGNTPNFTFEVLKLSSADFEATEHGLISIYNDHQTDKNIIDLLKDQILNYNSSMADENGKIKYENEIFSEADWAEVIETFVLKTVGSGSSLAVKATTVEGDTTCESYRFSLRELLYQVGKEYVELQNGDIGVVQNEINNNPNYEYVPIYYVLRNGVYKKLETKEAFTTANTNMEVIYRLENKWIIDVSKAANACAIVPGQYFIRVSIKDPAITELNSGGNGYQTDAIYASTTHVLDQWEVVDLKFVTGNLSFQIKDETNPGTTTTVNVTGKNNQNLILFTNEAALSNEMIISEQAKQDWANNSLPVYMTFRVKDTGRKYRPHSSSVGFTLYHYEAYDFTDGEPNWHSNENSGGQALTIGEDEYLGIDTEGYHVYVVNVKGLIDYNNEYEIYGLHKYKVLVNYAQDQAYEATLVGTEGMKDTDAYINFMRIKSPTFEFGFRKGGSGDNSGTAIVKVAFEFTNRLGMGLNKKLIPVLRAYSLPVDEEYLSHLPYDYDEELHGLSLQAESAKVYKTVWSIDLASIASPGPFAGLKKNALFMYQAYVDVNEVSPFLLNSLESTKDHVIVEGYDEPTIFSVQRTLGENYYENFVNENDAWIDVANETKYYNMSFKVNDSDAGRPAYALSDSDMIYDSKVSSERIQPWVYYNMTGITSDDEAKNFHYFILKVTRGNGLSGNGEHYEPFYYLVWYKVTNPQSIEGGEITQETQSEAYIRRIELTQTIDETLNANYIEYTEATLKEGITYHYYQNGQYIACETLEEAVQMHNNSEILYIQSNDARTKYVLEEYIELETSQREAEISQADLDNHNYAAYYVNRYWKRVEDTGHGIVTTYEPINYSVFDGRNLVDKSTGKLQSSIKVYAKQREIPHITYYGTGENSVGQYKLTTESGTVKQFVEFKNFGIELKTVVDEDDAHGLFFLKNINTINYSAQLFNEISFYTTKNSLSKTDIKVSHFVEVDKAVIESIKFTGTDVKNDHQYISEENENNVNFVLVLSNIKNASYIDLYYRISRTATGTTYLLNENDTKLACIEVPAKGKELTENGVNVKWVEKTIDNKVVYNLQITFNHSALLKMNILKYLPGDIDFFVHSVGYKENNGLTIYDSYIYDDGISNGVTLSGVLSKIKPSINKLSEANYLNSQQVAKYNTITIYRELNKISNAQSVNISLSPQQSTNSSQIYLFNDNTNNNSYLGTNLEAVAGGDNKYGVITNFMLLLNNKFNPVGLQGEEVNNNDKKDFLVNAVFNVNGTEITQQYSMGSTAPTGMSSIITGITGEATSTNKNIYELLGKYITKDMEITVTLNLYCNYGDGDKNYWLTGATQDFTFHIYRSVEIDELSVDANIDFASKEIISKDTSGKDFDSGFLVPNELGVQFKNQEEDQPTDGYRIDLDYGTLNKVTDIVIKKEDNNDIIIESDDNFNGTIIGNGNSRNLNILSFLNGFQAETTGDSIETKQAKIEHNAKLIGWVNGGVLTINITPYYKSGSYNVYGKTQKITKDMLLKLSNLRDISLEYFFLKDFVESWTAKDNIADKANEALLQRARLQPSYGLKLDKDGKNTKETAPIGVVGLRGLFYYNSPDYKKLSDYSCYGDKDHLTIDEKEDINYGAVDRYFALEVYDESKQNIVASYDYKASTPNNYLLGNYSFKQAQIVSVLNALMLKQEGGRYFVRYRLYSDSDNAGSLSAALTSDWSDFNVFYYRKVYSDYEDFELTQRSSGDNKDNYVDLKMPNKEASVINLPSNYYKSYNISKLLPISTQLYQKSVNASDTTLAFGGSFDKSNLKAYQKGDSWNYNGKNDSNDTELYATYTIHNDKLDALTFTHSDYVTAEFANALQQYGYIKGTYNNKEWAEHKGYLQIGQNLIHITIANQNSDTFNLGYKFIYNYKGSGVKNDNDDDGYDSNGNVVIDDKTYDGLKISMPQSCVPSANAPTITNGLFYYAGWVNQHVAFSDLGDYILSGPDQDKITNNEYVGYRTQNSDWDTCRDNYIYDDDYDKVTATVFANVVVQYGTYINKVQYYVYNRNNFVASQSESRLVFAQGQQQTKAEGKSGANTWQQVDNGNINDTIILKNDIENESISDKEYYKKLHHPSVTLTLTPMFGNAYESYGIKTVIKNDNIAANGSVAHNTYKYTSDATHGVTGVPTVDNFQLEDGYYVSGKYIYKQINLVTYHVYYISSVSVFNGLNYNTSGFSTWGMLYVEGVEQHNSGHNYYYDLNCLGGFDANWTAKKHLKWPWQDDETYGPKRNYGESELTLTADNQTTAKSLKALLRKTGPGQYFPCVSETQKNKYDSNSWYPRERALYQRYTEYDKNAADYLSGCCRRKDSSSLNNSSQLAYGYAMDIRTDRTDKDGWGINAKDPKSGTRAKITKVKVNLGSDSDYQADIFKDSEYSKVENALNLIPTN